MTANEYQNMLGAVITSIEVTEDKESMRFIAADGREFLFSHVRDCCETVSIEEVIGDLNDLIGSPLLMAEEVSSDDAPTDKTENAESFEWTFYKFATLRGHVTVRWLGTSSGYYSLRVSYEEIDPHYV